VGALFVWLFEALVSAGVAKFFSTVLLFFSVQLFISAFFNLGIAPSWLVPASITDTWHSFLAGASGISGEFSARLFWLANYLMLPYGLATLFNARVTVFIVRRLFK